MLRVFSLPNLAARLAYGEIFDPSLIEISAQCWHIVVFKQRQYALAPTYEGQLSYLQLAGTTSTSVVQVLNSDKSKLS